MVGTSVLTELRGGMFVESGRGFRGGGDVRGLDI